MRGADLTVGCIFRGTATMRFAQKVLEIEGADRYRTPFVLEGGAIHVDGHGTCLTTEECLLNPNRNGVLSREEVERTLQRYLGVTQVIWLGRGVYLDETGGHIDELACFTAPGHVVLTWTEDKTDPQYEISLDAYQRLKRARDARGPSTDDSQDSSAQSFVHDGTRGEWHRCTGGQSSAPRRRPAAGVLHQFLHCQQMCSDAAVRPAMGRSGRSHAQAAVPESPRDRRAQPAKCCSAAAIFIALRSKCRGRRSR